MAYFALPTRDSTFLLLVNAAPVLPHGSRITSTSSRPQLDAALSKLPVRLHTLSLATDYRRLGASILSNRGPRGRVYSSVEGSVTVEEPATDVETTSAPVEETAPETVAVEAEASESTTAPAKQVERRNSMQQRRAAKVISVQKEQLLPGAVFTGVVRAVQNYGAFVDIGAFTDGLIHISELSSSYVRSVEDVVSVGQELTVRVIEMDDKAGRIALTMRDKENEVAETEAQGGGQNEFSFTREGGDGKVQNRGKIAGRGGSSSRGRSNDDKKTTKLTKGQELAGKVKNIIRNGAFIELPDGEEGFLRGGEITEGGENVAVESLLQIGQEVTVRVLRIERGKVNLTMKAQVDMKSINKSINNNEEGGASNPFEVFFRNANLISSIESSEESSAAVQPAAEASVQAAETEAPTLVTPSNHSEEVSPASDEPASDKLASDEPATETAATVETPTIEEEKSESSATVDTDLTALSNEQVAEELAEAIKDITDLAESAAEDLTTEDKFEAAVDKRIEESPAPITDVVEVTEDAAPAPAASPATVDAESVGEETESSIPEPVTEEVSFMEPPSISAEQTSESTLTLDSVADTAAAEIPAPEATLETSEPTLTLDSVASEASPVEVPTTAPEAVAEAPQVTSEPTLTLDSVAPEASPVEAPTAAPEAVVEAPQVTSEPTLTLDSVAPEASPVEAPTTAPEAVVEAPPVTSEPTLTLDSVAPEVSPVEGPTTAPEAVAEAPPVTSEPTLTLDSVAPEASPIEAPTTAPEAVAEAPQDDQAKAAPSSGPTAAQVKQLRDITGAGMMECKRAMVACNSDVAKATEYLRKKGLASADKKASRVAAEGRVGSYVHDGRIGVLVEVNCETDFVSRGNIFKDLVADMGMQVVACPGVEYVSVDEVSPDYVRKEKEIEMGKEDLANKPPQIREKIVEGRIAKRLAELALLEQAYIRDDKILVKDLVKQTTASIGEKVQVRRFVRYNLGEGIAKKSVDFAAEVAAQTAAKADVKPAAETPKVEEVKEEDTTPKVAVPAATVKKLRDATGAGMMDCKKALVACDNDVEKATEYLRKKGLASADKKSSRIASEGLIGSYIHDGRIGVLIEVNSETDFVARSAQFKELVSDMGMQVAACPQVQYVSVDEIPAEIVDKEKEIESGKEDLAKKPEGVRSKIVEGRVAKTLNELALLEQPYIRDDKLSVKEYIKQTIASLGENIQVRRFTRFNLGEGIEKRSTDFAAEVAAQTAAKA